MADYTVKSIDDMAGTLGGAFKLARAELGVTSFGMQVLDLPANLTEGYPTHDHAETGQEEVYIVLSGSGTMTIDGDDVALEQGVAVRVGPEARRGLVTGPQGMRMLALGGVPGAVYEINPRTELSALNN